MEVTFLVMEISMLGSIFMGSPRASDSINGLMGQHIQVNLKMEWKMDRENGEERLFQKIIA